MIKGIGVDIVPIGRIQNQKDKAEFLAQVLTGEEFLSAPAGSSCDAFYARILATKEAVLKALGCGLQQGSLWHDIAVTKGWEVRLSGRIKNLAEEQAIFRIHVTHSSSTVYAVAIVLCETNNPKVTS